MNQLFFALAHYAALLLLAGVSYALGRTLTGRLRYGSAAEAVCFSTGLGLGALSLLLFGLGMLGLLYPGVVLAALALLQIPAYPVWRDLFGKLRALPRALAKGPWALAGAWLGKAAFAFIALLPLYPPTAADATTYHLAYAKVYAANHGIVFTPYLHYPVFPQANEMLFTLMYLFYDDVAAQLVQFLMVGLTAVALYAWGSRVFSPRAGWWAAALWLSSPLVLWLGSVAYIDAGLALFACLAAYALGNWLCGQEPAWLVLAAAFSGLAAASKYTGLFFVACFGLVTLAVSLRQRRWALPLVFAAVAGLVAAGWYARNLYYTGNPLFPLLTHAFGRPDRMAEDLEGFRRLTAGRPRTVASLLCLPWTIAFDRSLFRLEALPSPLYFFALPLLPLFGARHRYLRGLLALTVAYTLFWFFLLTRARHLVPIIPVFSLASAACLERFWLWLPPGRRGAWPGLVTAAGAGLLLLPGWLDTASRVHKQGPVPVTPAQRDAYLARHLPAYPAYQLLNQLRGRDYAVYGLCNAEMAYFSDGLFLGDRFGPARYARVLEKLADGRALYDELRSLGVGYFVVVKHRLGHDLPGDAYFTSHFKLIYARADVLLFELSPEALHCRLGPERLESPGFEECDAPPSGKGEQGSDPGADAFGRPGPTAAVAGRSERRKDFHSQALLVRPGELYRLSVSARTEDRPRRLRLEVVWLDGQGQPLNREFEVVEATAAWRRCELAVTVPSGAAAVAVGAAPHDQRSLVWFEDFSFRQVDYAPAGR